MTSPTDLLDNALRSDPARPRLTWYDQLTGERVELSGATLANWVNKTANLLVTELGAGPGVSVWLDLPRHWLLPVWVLAVDKIGASSLTANKIDSGAAPLVAVIGPASLDAVTNLPASVEEIVAVSLKPMGAPFEHALPTMVRDYAIDVRGQADNFTGRSAGNEAAGQRATTLAAEWSLLSSDRVVAYGHIADCTREFLAPLAADASVVWLRNPEEPKFVELLATERVTAGVGRPPIGSASDPSVRWLT